MIPLALLTVLLQGTVSVPPSHWRAVDVDVPKPGTEVRCTFSVPEGSSRVQASLITWEDAERFSRNRPFSALASSGFEHEGSVKYLAERAGRYVLLLDNRMEGRRATPVSITVEVVAPLAVPVRTLPAERKRAVVLLSVLSFLGVIAWSARKLMK